MNRIGWIFIAVVVHHHKCETLTNEWRGSMRMRLTNYRGIVIILNKTALYELPINRLINRIVPNNIISGVCLDLYQPYFDPLILIIFVMDGTLPEEKPPEMKMLRKCLEIAYSQQMDWLEDIQRP